MLFPVVMQMKTLKGKTLVAGLGFGLVTKISPLTMTLTNRTLSPTEQDQEIKKAHEAINRTLIDLNIEYEENKNVLNEETLAIINGHIILVEDGEISDRIIDYITTESIDFVSACIKTKSEYVSIFNSMDNTYLKERIADIEDICHRFVKSYQHIEKTLLEGIVVGKEISPSDILRFKPDGVKGIISEVGTMTCHSAILARTLGIPFVTGIDGIVDLIRNQDYVLVDGHNHQIIINPDNKTKKTFLVAHRIHIHETRALDHYIGQKAQLRDKTPYSVGINISNANDVSIGERVEADSVGLFRSEYLYMDLETFPTEEALYQQYLTMTKPFSGDVTIRTLDVGGDKSIDYFNIPKETNPYLGYRAIRYCLDHEEVFNTQLKAILRLSANRHVRIMIPMVTSVDEVTKVKHHLRQSMADLSKQHIPYDPNIKLGIMIETPASVMISDILAQQLDFFSIGTNDLLQYTMATDRNNALVEHYHNPYSHALIRMIEKTVVNAHQQGIPVSVCGELASDLPFISLLIGLGVDHISVSPSALLRVKKHLSTITVAGCQEIIKRLATVHSEKELFQLITQDKTHE